MSKKTEYIAHCREKDGKIQSLVDHLEEVSKLTGEFASKIGLKEQGELIGLLHDLGKYSKEFQDYIQSATGMLNPDEDEDYVDAQGLKGKIDHSTAGAQFLWSELKQYDRLGMFVGQILSLCVASHHSGVVDCLETNGKDNFTRRMSKDYSKTHFDEVLKKVEPEILQRAKEFIKDPNFFFQFQKQFSAIAARNNSSIVAQTQWGLLLRMLFSCLIDADRTNTADFESRKTGHVRQCGNYKAWDDLINRFEEHLRQIKNCSQIDVIRTQISQYCLDGAKSDRGIFTLTVPTGGGKTLASLRFALHHVQKYKMDRIIYVVPYTSIIDQNAEVIRKILEPGLKTDEVGTVVLEHHSNLTPEKETWKSRMLSENWDAPIIFTTSVQLLETLFGAGTRDVRRMHQLANSVIIFDEIQTLPIKCAHIFSNAMNFLVDNCGSSVVLCTATQPLLNHIDPTKGALKCGDTDELIPNVSQLFRDLKRVDVIDKRKTGGWSDEDITTLATNELEESGSCLVIVNTKKAAQSIYLACKNKSQIPVYHLSTNMCPAHRRSILGEIRSQLDHKPSLPVLCVSTQLIEAGVDIDFGSVIRCVAGIDSIAQAAGRCNRHGIRNKGRVFIVNPCDEKLERLPDIEIGKTVAERILSEFERASTDFQGDILSPSAVERYFKYYFYNRQHEMDYPLNSKGIGRNDNLLNLLSTNELSVTEHRRINNDKSPEIFFRQSFMTAAKAFKVIDAPTHGIVVPFGKVGKEIINTLCSGFMIDKQYDLLRKAQQYSVNIFSHVLEKLQKDEAVFEVQKGTGILYLIDEYYSKEFGVMDSRGETTVKII